MAFIEVTSRDSNASTMVLNTEFIVKVTDDGVGAQIAYVGKKDGANGSQGIEIHKCAETYAEVKTALGL